MNFNDFINESWEEIDYSANKNAAGVAIVWQDSVLLVHPTNASWKRTRMVYPREESSQEKIL
jgi:hypothetical protein